MRYTQKPRILNAQNWHRIVYRKRNYFYVPALLANIWTQLSPIIIAAINTPNIISKDLKIMTKFLAVAAFLALIAAPAMAEDHSAHAVAAPVAAEVSVTEITTPVSDTVIVEETTVSVEGDTATITTEAVSATDVNVTAATEACTKETNEKVKLPEGASDAEKAQWNAALAECLKAKGVPAAE